MPIYTMPIYTMPTTQCLSIQYQLYNAYLHNANYTMPIYTMPTIQCQLYNAYLYNANYTMPIYAIHVCQQCASFYTTVHQFKPLCKELQMFEPIST